MRHKRIVRSERISSCLMKVLWEARCEQRLTCGVFESGNKLHVNAENVKLCLLPYDLSDDVDLHIHSMLLKAFCLENGIHVIKIDTTTKRDKLLDVLYLEPDTDLNCLLVEYTVGSISGSEENLIDFCQNSSVPFPFVELPI